MRKSFLLSGSCLLLLCISLSCYHSYGGTSIKITERKDAYEMSASFNPDRTRKVHEYMDKKIGRRNNISFVNSEIDATLTLDDRTTFHLKSTPGTLEIKLDKADNSYESYERVKEMCQGIKAILEEKQEGKNISVSISKP